MKGRDVAFLAGGLAVGVLVAWQLTPVEQSCCARVSGAVRGKVAALPFGEFFAGLGDRLNLWKHAPGLLDLFGVPADA